MYRIFLTNMQLYKSAPSLPLTVPLSLDQRIRNQGDWSLNSQLTAIVGTQVIVTFLIHDMHPCSFEQ